MFDLSGRVAVLTGESGILGARRAHAVPQSQQKLKKSWTRMLRVGIVNRNFEHGVRLSSGSNMSEAHSECISSQCYDEYLTTAGAVKAACRS